MHPFPWLLQEVLLCSIWQQFVRWIFPPPEDARVRTIHSLSLTPSLKMIFDAKRHDLGILNNKSPRGLWKSAGELRRQENGPLSY